MCAMRVSADFERGRCRAASQRVPSARIRSRTASRRRLGTSGSGGAMRRL